MVLRSAWLKAERITREVNTFLAIYKGYIKFLPEGTEWILNIQLFRKFFCVLKIHSIVAITFSSIEIGVGRLKTSTVVLHACTPEKYSA